MGTADDDRHPAAVDVSVLTLVNGRFDHLAELVRGVERSATRPREVVVAAIGEPDLALELDTSLDLRIVHLDLERDGIPLAAARNRAAEAARGRDLLVLDVDCVPSRRLIGAAAALLAEQDVLAMAPIAYLPPGVTPSESGEEALLETATFLGSRPRLPASGERTEDRLFWSTAFAVRRTTMIDRIGGFDPAYVGYGAEDTDLGLRAGRAGVAVSWIGPEPAFHQHHRSLSPPADKLEAIVRNAAVFRRRWGFWPMDGWLAGFAARGWIDWAPGADRLDVLRHPSAAELRSIAGG